MAKKTIKIGEIDFINMKPFPNISIVILIYDFIEIVSNKVELIMADNG